MIPENIEAALASETSTTGRVLGADLLTDAGHEDRAIVLRNMALLETDYVGSTFWWSAPEARRLRREAYQKLGGAGREEFHRWRGEEVSKSLEQYAWLRRGLFESFDLRPAPREKIETLLCELGLFAERCFVSTLRLRSEVSQLHSVVREQLRDLECGVTLVAAQFPQLERLKITRPLSAEELRFLCEAPLPRLRSLSIRLNEALDAETEALFRRLVRRVERLTLRGSNHLREVLPAAHLRSLRVDYNPLLCRDLLAEVALSPIEELTLFPGVHLPLLFEETVEMFEQMPRLQHLNIGYMFLPTVSWERVGALPLRSLEIFGGQASRPLVEMLSRNAVGCEPLRRLAIRRVPNGRHLDSLANRLEIAVSCGLLRRLQSLEVELQLCGWGEFGERNLPDLVELGLAIPEDEANDIEFYSALNKAGLGSRLALLHSFKSGVETPVNLQGILGTGGADVEVLPVRLA